MARSVDYNRTASAAAAVRQFCGHGYGGTSGSGLTTSPECPGPASTERSSRNGGYLPRFWIDTKPTWLECGGKESRIPWTRGFNGFVDSWPPAVGHSGAPFSLGCLVVTPHHCTRSRRGIVDEDGLGSPASTSQPDPEVSDFCVRA
jgi:hypothetical protein